jgi:hypothetical protein
MSATGDMTPKELRARVESAGAWGLVGSTTDANRYTVPKPDRRGRRICWVCTKAGASTRATHRCFANGVCLTADMCEFHAHQWVREPS